MGHRSWKQLTVDGERFKEMIQSGKEENFIEIVYVL